MSKMRVHEVAKELGLSSKETMARLAALGIEVKSHSSTITDDQAARLKAEVVAPAPAQVEEAPPPPPTKIEEAPAKPKAAAKKAQTAKPAVDKPAQVEAPEADKPAAQEDVTAEVQVAQPSDGKVETPAAPGGNGAVHVPRGVTVEEFATKTGHSASEIIKLLLQMGEMKTITQSLSDDAVEVLGQELGVSVEIISPEEEEAEQQLGAEEPEDEGQLEPRAPIVTVMGHVDHGKSSILQHYRRKEMLSLEAGGITQAIGAYQVHDPEGREVTFIDTPGHEAFTQMRARGAQVTDVAILVVAADDGVQPQTVEALDHARAAKVPVIVAVNKVDKPESDPTRVRQQLAELGVQPEEWGGDTVFVDVSAKAGTNMDDLLEMIHLVADLQELKANPNAAARGVVIEAHLDKGRGPVATLIVQKGTIRVGDPVVAGSAWCRVRALTDETGKQVTEAKPSEPVLVTGWSKVPSAGDDFRTVSDEREARHIAQEREAKHRQAEFVAGGRSATLEDLLSKTRTGEIPELRLILKADTQGSLEALADSIEKTDQERVRTAVLRRAVGAINENDVTLAQASGAIVVGFNVRPDAGARQLAEKEGVDIRVYEVIYQLLEDIDKASKGLLAPVEEEVVQGAAEVRQTFKIPRGVVAGCYVTEGKILRNAKARLIREGAVVYTSEVSSLRRFKEDVREVAAGYECGITILGYTDIHEGDVIETFEVREVAAV